MNNQCCYIVYLVGMYIYGYYCCYVHFEVRYDADETVKHEMSPMATVCSCEVCTEATETAEQRAYGTAEQNQMTFTLILFRK